MVCIGSLSIGGCLLRPLAGCRLVLFEGGPFLVRGFLGGLNFVVSVLLSNTTEVE